MLFSVDTKRVVPKIPTKATSKAMDKSERRVEEEARGVDAKSFSEPLAGFSVKHTGEGKGESEHLRAGSEACSVHSTQHDEGDGSPPKASSRPDLSVSCGVHGRNDNEAIHEDTGMPRRFPKSSKSNENPSKVKTKRQLGEGGHIQNSNNSGHSVPASPVAGGVQRSKTLHDDENKPLKKRTRMGRQYPSAGEASTNKRNQQSTKVSPSEASASTSGSGCSEKHNGNSPNSVSEISKEKKAATTSVEQGDRNASGKNSGKPIDGGWLNIFRAASSASGESPAGGEGEEAGSRPGPGVSSQRPVSSRSPAKSDLRVKRKPQISQEAHGHQSDPQSSSNVQPNDTALSVHTREVETEAREEEGDGVDVEEAVGWRGWCTWFNVWLGLGAFGMVVVLPLGLVLLPHEGHIYPRGPPANKSKERGDPWSAATPLKPRAPVIPLETAYNESELERPPKCAFPDRAIVENLTAPYPGQAKHNITGPQYRPVICVVDASYIYRRESSMGFGYDVKAVPTQYCTALVYYAMTFLKGGTVELKLRAPWGTKALRDLHEASKANHRNQTIDVYLTIGGSREDSFGIGEVITQDEKWPFFSESINTLRTNFEGVNLDWNRPGDECSHHIGDGKLSRGLRNFISFLKKGEGLKVMLTVPPLLHLTEFYNLSALLQDLDFVVVTTHKLRRPGVVACTGERVLAAGAFLNIREHFLKQEDTGAVLRKFAYSISAGADIYKLANRTKVEYLAPIKRISNVFIHRKIMPGKTCYPGVCSLWPVDSDSLQECSVVMGSRTVNKESGIEQEVAAMAGPEQLKMRMRRSYEDGMGDTPVAVFDAIMDDIRGQCSETGSGSDSPLLQAIAETGPA